MRIFTVNNHYQNYLISALQLYLDFCASLIVLVLCGANKMLRAIVLLSNCLKKNCVINLFKYFPVFLEWWKIYVSRIIFDILSRLFSMLWWFNATVVVYWKQLLASFFCGFIVTLLFLNHSGDIMYDLPLLILFYKDFQKQTRFLSFFFLILPDILAKRI